MMDGPVMGLGLGLGLVNIGNEWQGYYLFLHWPVLLITLTSAALGVLPAIARRM
jgi:hypothetical protein